MVTTVPVSAARGGNRARPAEARLSAGELEAGAHDWSLYWADRNGRWHRYDAIPPGRVDQVLREIESDPTGIFWG